MLQGAFFKASTFKTMWLGWGIWCHHSRVFLFCFGVFVLVLLRLQKSNFLLAFFFSPFNVPTVSSPQIDESSRRNGG